MSSVIGGVVGAVLTTAIFIGWANNNPAEVTRLVNRVGQDEVGVDDSSAGTVFVPSSDQEASVVDVVKRTNPAVVSIVVTQDVPVLERYFEDYSPFPDFFGQRFQIPQYRERGTQEREIGGGSGFLVSADGLIITNKHVVSQEDVEYTVFTNDGTKHTARIIARDPANDLAIMKIDGSNFPYLTFSSADGLQVGQTVIAIGNALGEFRNTVSVGVISGLARSVVAGDPFGQAEQLENVIQTDAAINPGNSGGPLLNLQGQVVGVNVAVALGSQNVGFALPGDVANTVVQSVQTTGTISRPFLGVRYTMVTAVLQEKNNYPFEYGALVIPGEDPTDVAVVPGSAAADAGLVAGDVILEIDGTRLDASHSLAAVINQKKVGQEITLKIWRNGTTQEHTVRLKDTPQS